MAESNLIRRSCCEAVFPTFPCYAVSFPCSRPRALSWQSKFPQGLADKLDTKTPPLFRFNLLKRRAAQRGCGYAGNPLC